MSDAAPMDEDHASPRRSVRRPGRPRDEGRSQAILQATLDVLAEVGFEAMSIERVAARAGVGKTTIYRRWASKEALVVEAVRAVHSAAPVVDTGDLRADLLTLARSAEQGAPRDTLERLMPRFLAEATTNPTLFEAYVQSIIVPRLGQFTSRIERAQASGEIRADLDPGVVIDLIVGALLSRLLLTGHVAPITHDFVERMMDTLWHGLAGTSASGLSLEYTETQPGRIAGMGTDGAVADAGTSGEPGI